MPSVPPWDKWHGGISIFWTKTLGKRAGDRFSVLVEGIRGNTGDVSEILKCWHFEEVAGGGWRLKKFKIRTALCKGRNATLVAGAIFMDLRLVHLDLMCLMLCCYLFETLNHFLNKRICIFILQ